MGRCCNLSNWNYQIILDLHLLDYRFVATNRVNESLLLVLVVAQQFALMHLSHGLNALGVTEKDDIICTDDKDHSTLAEWDEIVDLIVLWQMFDLIFELAGDCIYSTDGCVALSTLSANIELLVKLFTDENFELVTILRVVQEKIGYSCDSKVVAMRTVVSLRAVSHRRSCHCWTSLGSTLSCTGCSGGILLLLKLLLLLLLKSSLIWYHTLDA